MYTRPRIDDFGQIELHTFQVPGSSPENTEEAAQGGGGGDGVGFGLIGLLGVAGVGMAGRGSDNQPAAVVPPSDEEEKNAQK